MIRGDFSGKVVWLTGASSGIGKALALALSSDGAKLILSARDKERLTEVGQDCRGASEVRILPLDLAEPDTLAGKVEAALAMFGHVDCMIHNAGVASRDLAISTDLSVDRRVMDTNYFGPVAITKALLPVMLQRRSGCFVVVSSLSGKFGGPKFSAYAASKHALHGFFDSLRTEVQPENIQITIVIPGFVRTPITERALTGDGAPYGKMLSVHERGMDPHKCAARILRAVAAGKEEVLIGGPEVYSVYVSRFFPRLLSRVIRRHPLRTIRRLRRALGLTSKSTHHSAD